MVDLLRPGRRGGIATTNYPDEPEPAPLAFRGQVQLHRDRCVGDGACARACPSQAIAIVDEANGGWIWQLDDARCVFCGLCADACPTGAILLSNEFELSVRRREWLTIRVPFPTRRAASRKDREIE